MPFLRLMTARLTTVGLRIAALATAALLLPVNGQTQCTPAADSILDQNFSLATLCSLVDKDSTNPRLLKPIPLGENWELQPGAKIELRKEIRTNFNMQHIEGTQTYDKPRFLYGLINAMITNKKKDKSIFLELYGVYPNNYNPAWDPYESCERGLLQAWYEYKFPNSPWSVKIGRQCLPNMGEMRLMGEGRYYWHYNAHDGVVATRKTDKMATYLIAAYMYTFKGRDEYTGRNFGQQMRPANKFLTGVYNTWYLPKKYEFDLYNLNVHTFEASPYRSSDGTTGRAQMYGFGSRVRGPLYHKKDLGTLIWGTEAMTQVGNYGGDSKVFTYMLHGDLIWKFDKPWDPSIMLFGNIASGNKDPLSNKINRFDVQLDPSHYAYGLVNVVKLTNMNEIGVAFQVQPNKKTTIRTSAHQFWLNSAKDAWIGADGRTIAWDVTGSSGRDLGRELALMAKYEFNSHWSIECGGGYFFTGNFGKNVGHGADSWTVYCHQIFNF